MSPIIKMNLDLVDEIHLKLLDTLNVINRR